MIGGLLAMRGVRGGSIWVWLAGGMAIFCAADVAYAIRVDAGIYAVGPWLTSGVDDRRHLHRSLALVAAAAGGDRRCALEDDAGDPDAGDRHRGRDPRDLLLWREPGRDVAGNLHAAARRREDLRELPAGSTPLRRPSPGRHRRPHRAREPALALRAWRREPRVRGRRRSDRADPDRPGQLQGDQRQLRSSRGRRAAPRDRAAPRRLRERRRPARAARG